MTATDETCATTPRRSLLFGALISVVLGLAASRSLWADLFPYGHSSLLDYERVLLMKDYFGRGIFWPRWMIPPFFGYGTPIWQFYSPGYYWICALLSAAGIASLVAMKAVWTASNVLAGFGIYLLAGRFASGRNQLAAGAAAVFLYVLAPTHLCDQYVRSASASLAAYALWPFAILMFLRYAESRRAGDAAGAAALFAGIIYTHNISALFAAAVIVTLPVLFVSGKKDLGALGRHAAVFLLGTGLAAAFWLPALLQTHYLQIKSAMLNGYWDYSQHFATLKQLLWSPWEYGTSLPGPRDTMTLQAGLPHLAALAAAAFLIAWTARKERKADRVLIYLFAMSIIALFLTLGASRFVWKVFPFTQWVQFPWRYLSLAAFLTALAGATVVQRLGRIFGDRGALAGGLLLIVSSTALYLPWAKAMGTLYDPVRLKPRMIALKDERRAIESGLVRPESVLTIDYVRKAGKDLTANHDYAPIWVQSMPAEMPPAPAYIEGNHGRVIGFRELATGYEISIETSAPTTLVVQAFYFPGWSARTARGEALPLGTMTQKGLLSVEAPAGLNRVDIKFGPTPAVRTAERISLASLAVLFLLVLIPRNQQKRI